MAEYGIPYMGSKDRIIDSLALNFPKADHFYDLFGGGFSVTHYMLTHFSKRYKSFHYNELNPLVVDVVKRAINGEFNYDRNKPKWISREEFFEKKDVDGYIKTCWSFGNGGKYYLFSKEIEPYKKAMHQAIVFDEFNEIAEKTLRFTKWPSNVKTFKQRRLYLSQLIDHYRKTKIPVHLHQFLNEDQIKKINSIDNLRRLEHLEQLQRLERLERLEQLEQLEQLQRLNITNLSYDQVDILPNSIVYCDIPYGGTEDYGNSFNRQKFFDWAASRDFPVFISEYNVEDPRFKLIYSIDKISMLSSDKTVGNKSERLYWNGK